jgi:hypothetical protein
MAKPPRQIIGYIKNPETYDALTLETALRAEIENSTGSLTASDEVLVGTILLLMDSFLEAQAKIEVEGMMTQYSSGVAPSGWYRVRTESIDKIVKIMGELGLVARGRPKKQNKATEVDELFANA